MVEAKKGNPFGSINTSRCPDIVDVDADHKDPQLCCIYAPDIYNNLHVSEVCVTSIFFLPLLEWELVNFIVFLCSFY